MIGSFLEIAANLVASVLVVGNRRNSGSRSIYSSGLQKLRYWSKGITVRRAALVLRAS